MANKDATLYYSGYSGVTAQAVADFLGKTLNTSEQNIVTALISSIELFIAQKCRRNFKYDLGSDFYEETFDAGSYKYYFHNFPVKEVAKITVGDQDVYVKGGGANLYEINKDFFVYRDSIVFLTIPQSTYNRQALKIAYSIEKFWGEDLELGIKQWAAQIFTQKEYGGKNVSSFNFAGLSISFNQEPIPEYIQQLIKTYKKVLV